MLICIIILTAAFVLDILFGDPVYRFHPVRIIGNFITFLTEKLYNSSLNKFISGFLLTLTVILVFTFTYVLCYYLLEKYVSIYLAYLLNIYVVYSCISLKDLIKHSQKIATGLDISITKGRQEVQLIVGRDANLLDKIGIIRATIECIAESFVDGILSPLFWFTAGVFLGLIFNLDFLVLGVLLVLVQRIVNTIDSMIGYKNNKYILFGRFGAKLDDVLNYIPARLSIFFITTSSIFLGLNYFNSLNCALRDRLKHASPNSAHPEAAVAGALKIRLGGPTVYPHGEVKKPFIGDEIDKINIAHISVAGKLIIISSYISLLLFCIIIISLSGQY